METHLPGLESNVDHRRVWDLGYELLERVRQEQFCDVWQIRQRQTYELFVWKQIRTEYTTHPRARGLLENEVAVGQLIHSPFFLQLVESHLQNAPRYAIWHWFEASTLEELFRQYVRLPGAPALWIIRQCAEALDVLAQAGLTHGDMRAENILIDPKSGLVKLIGLSSARRIQASAARRPSLNDTWSGLSDQTFREPIQSAASPHSLHNDSKDVFGLGMILYRALTGRHPLDVETPADIVRGREVNVVEKLRNIRPDVSGEMAELIRDMIQAHSSRPIANPATLVRRLIDLELSELARLDPRRDPRLGR